MIRLYVAASLAEAHLLLALLADERITAHVFNEHAAGAMGEIPFTHAYPEVWLDNPADLPEARQVIGEYEQQRDLTGSRICQSCGEQSPASFELCWQCGAAFAAAD